MNRAHGALLLATLSWGVSLTTSDAALGSLRAADLLALEVGTGTAAAALVCLLSGRRLGGAWRPALILGGLQPGLSYVFANLGLVLTSAAVGSMLFSLESVFVVLIAWLVVRARPRSPEFIALALGVTGTIMVASAKDGGHSSAAGVALLLLSTVAAAAYTFGTQRLAEGHEPFALVVRQGAASLIVTGPFMLGSWLSGGSQLGSAPAHSLLLAMSSGILGFALPMTLWTWGAPKVRPGTAAVALNLTPLFGVISATVFGQGALVPAQWAGGAVILAGVAILTRAEASAPAPPLGPTAGASEPTDGTQRRQQIMVGTGTH
jgi:drug/metabolite transporter (DMT)-like permease